MGVNIMNNCYWQIKYCISNRVFEKMIVILSIFMIDIYN